MYGCTCAPSTESPSCPSLGLTIAIAYWRWPLPLSTSSTSGATRRFHQCRPKQASCVASSSPIEYRGMLHIGMGLSENRGVDRFTGYAWLMIIPAGCAVMVAASHFSFNTTLVASARYSFFFT